MVQVDVVGGCPACAESDGRSDYKGDCLRLCLPYRLRGDGPALGLMQHLVCELMDKGAELLGCALAGEDGDSTAVAHPQRWRDALFELKPDALGGDEVEQPFAVLSDIALYSFGKLGKICAVGLADILSRDLRPARPATLLRRRVRMYSSIAVHGCLDCYAYLPCEAKFR